MSTKAEELQRKLQRRREAADTVCFESQPDKSAADVGRNSVDLNANEVAADKDEKSRRPEKKSTQDFKSAMDRQRGKTEDGLNFESNPEATRADVTFASGPGQSSPEDAPQRFESKPEATRADVTSETKRDSLRSSPENTAQFTKGQAKKRGAAAKPDATKTTEQEAVPKVTSPKAASPKAASGKAASPKAAAPKDASPKAARPEAATAASFEVPDAPVQNDGDSDSSEADTEGDMPHLEGGAHASAHAEGKQNRSEKKSRKAVLKLGMKPFAGISRVTMKKTPNVLFVIERPEVFKAASSETYVVFGEARIEDLSAQAQASAAQQMTSTIGDSSGEAQRASKAVEVDEDDEEVDESGIEEKDIELVVAQGGVSRARAVKALKASGNDIVEAIMALSTD